MSVEAQSFASGAKQRQSATASALRSHRRPPDVRERCIERHVERVGEIDHPVRRPQHQTNGFVQRVAFGQPPPGWQQAPAGPGSSPARRQHPGEKAHFSAGFRQAAQAAQAGNRGTMGGGARGTVIGGRARGVWAGAALLASERAAKRRGCRRIITSDKVQLPELLLPSVFDSSPP